MLQIYFGIDPGKNTGLVKMATVETVDQPLVLAKATISVPTLAYAWVDRLYLADIPTAFILEQPAIRKPGAKPVTEMFGVWREKISSWTQANDKTTLTIYGPGQWKPFAKANKWKRPKWWTQHETDAANLVRFYIMQVRRSIVPMGLLSTDSRVEELVALIQKEIENEYNK